MKFKAATSGANISTSSSIMKPIPEMEMNVSIPENGEMVIIFSAESYSSYGSQALVSLQIGQKFYSANMVTLASGNKYLGVHSFVFVIKHFNAKANASLENIKLLWSSGGNGTAYMGDRTMTVLVEKGGVPDLAEPPAIGAISNPVNGFPGGIEPMTGSVPLLTVIIDPNQANVPKPSWSDVNDLLFGSHSTRDYFDKISGGRFNLTNAGVFNVIPNLPHPDIYWEQHSCDCENDDDCDTLDIFHEVGYTGGHQRKWADAMDGIDAAFNFAAYDKNKDGILDPRELAILIITPAETEGGTVRGFRPYCQGHPNVPNTLGGAYYADGVRFVAIAEWYTDAADSTDFITPTHELGHLLLNLGDLYIEDIELATEPAQYDLMGESTNASPHLQGRTKLALGWATPRFMRFSTNNVLVRDVRQSEEVIIMPRTSNVDGKEFFLLENRQNQAVDAKYDENILGTGIAIWHIVETEGDADLPPNQVACKAGGLANWDLTDHGRARRTSRLIRLKEGRVSEEDDNGGGNGGGNTGGGLPGNLNNQTGPNRELWKNTTYAINPNDSVPAYDLTSYGFVCPTGTYKGKMALVWADYSPSGYALRNFSMGWPSMRVDIEVPMGLGTGAYPCPNDSDPSGGVIGGKRREGLVANEIVSTCEIYPNPFREYANFSFSLKQDAHAKLEIFNLSGQRMAVPFEGSVEAGAAQQGRWHAGDLATGLYIYRLTSDAGDVIQGKINLIR
jgi:M6 family metalloprotease-like protein